VKSKKKHITTKVTVLWAKMKMVAGLMWLKLSKKTILHRWRWKNFDIDVKAARNYSRARLDGENMLNGWVNAERNVSAMSFHFQSILIHSLGHLQRKFKER
jgi:hypothetical protein